MTDKLYRETINLFTIRQGYYYHLNAFDQVTNTPDDAPADLLFWARGKEKVERVLHIEHARGKEGGDELIL